MSFMIGFLCGGLLTFIVVLVEVVMYLEREESNEE